MSENRIDPSSPQPLYEQLVALLRKQIAEGVYQKNQQIPTEAALSEMYEVSRITVRRAVRDLVESGLVEKRQGKGTFVTGSKFVRSMAQDPVSFSDFCRANGRIPRAHILEAGITTPEDPEVREQLGLQEGEQAVRIRRLRYAGDQPLILEDNYFPQEYSYLLGIDLENDSIYRYLKEEKGIEMLRASTRIRIVRADNRLAKLLKVQKNSPQLEMRGRIIRRSDGAIVHTSYQIGYGEDFELTV